MELKPDEVDLVGQGVRVIGQVRCDPICERINWLTTHYLRKVASGDWVVLYEDPDDRRFWELFYPESELQGGGPPRLTVLTRDQARAKVSIPLTAARKGPARHFAYQSSRL